MFFEKLNIVEISDLTSLSQINLESTEGWRTLLDTTSFLRRYIKWQRKHRRTRRSIHQWLVSIVIWARKRFRKRHSTFPSRITRSLPKRSWRKLLSKESNQRNSWQGRTWRVYVTRSNWIMSCSWCYRRQDVRSGGQFLFDSRTSSWISRQKRSCPSGWLKTWSGGDFSWQTKTIWQTILQYQVSVETLIQLSN